MASVHLCCFTVSRLSQVVTRAAEKTMVILQLLFEVTKQQEYRK